MADKIDEEEYRRMRRIASYHLLRVGALVGVFVGKAFGALVALEMQLNDTPEIE